MVKMVAMAKLEGVQRKRAVVLAACAVVCLFVLPIASFRFWTWHEKRRVFQGDHEALLLACRQLIRDRPIYVARAAKSPYSPDCTNCVLSLGQDAIATTVAQVIRELRPKEVVIGKDYVWIRLKVPRVDVLAFAEGAKQFGTIKMIDGLWYWDGTEPGRKYGEMRDRK